MFFIIGGGNKEEILDFNQTRLCPECSSYGRLQVILRYNSLNVFFIPILKWSREYLVRTSCCNSIYTINNELGKKIERNQIKAIKNEELKPFKVYKDNSIYCNKCSSKVETGFKFCPNCGSEI